MALREDIEFERFEDGVCFIENKTNVQLYPKLFLVLQIRLVYQMWFILKPLSRILPVGFNSPKAKAITDKANKLIDDILDQYMSREEKMQYW